jgi:hypothetical protein
MSDIFTLPPSTPKIRQIKNPWFHVESLTLEQYMVSFVQLDKDYHSIAVNSDSRRESSTHRKLHGKERGRRSFDVLCGDVNEELRQMCKEAVIYHADKFNFKDAVHRIRNQSGNWLLYEEDLGCPAHCDDQDPADAEYGLGTTLFNWANQVVCLLYTSECGVDFEGGELIMHNQRQIIRPRRGEIVIFPGTYTHIHSVRPITKGIRTVYQTTWRFDDKNP